MGHPSVAKYLSLPTSFDGRHSITEIENILAMINQAPETCLWEVEESDNQRLKRSVSLGGEIASCENMHFTVPRRRISQALSERRPSSCILSHISDYVQLNSDRCLYQREEEQSSSSEPDTDVFQNHERIVMNLSPDNNYEVAADSGIDDNEGGSNPSSFRICRDGEPSGCDVTVSTFKQTKKFREKDSGCDLEQDSSAELDINNNILPHKRPNTLHLDIKCRDDIEVSRNFEALNCSGCSKKIRKKHINKGTGRNAAKRTVSCKFETTQGSQSWAIQLDNCSHSSHTIHTVHDTTSFTSTHVPSPVSSPMTPTSPTPRSPARRQRLDSKAFLPIFDMNYRDSLGNTPLHNAAMRGDAPLVLYVLSLGANVWSVNKAGQLPLDVCSNFSTAKLLTKRTIFYGCRSDWRNDARNKRASGMLTEL